MCTLKALLSDGRQLGIIFCLHIMLAFSPYGTRNVWPNKLKMNKSLLWQMTLQWLAPISSRRWHSSPFWWECVTEEATHVRDPARKDRCKKWTSFHHPPLRAYLKDLISQRFHHFPIPFQSSDQRVYTGTVGAHFRSPLGHPSWWRHLTG